MKRSTTILGVIALCGGTLQAQHIDPFFNTIGTITESRQPIRLEAEPVPSEPADEGFDEASGENAQTIERITDLLHLRERKGEKERARAAF